MAKFLVPVTGHLVIEADSAQHAEIIGLNWGQSLLCRVTESKSIENSLKVTFSQHNIVKQSSAGVRAVSLSFPLDGFVDVTEASEMRREQATTRDYLYRQKRGLPETDLTDEQLILFSLLKDGDQN